MSTKRLVFANDLRGVAAISVAASHLIGVYWYMREAVTAATFTPPQPGPLHGWTALVSHPWFNFGPFGVGLFFLISGLVIPISLASHTRGSFLLARVLRIYPVYVVALLLEMLMLRGNAALWGLPFTHSTWAIVSNALLIQDLVGQPSLDLVNWTLCVELRFYLLAALFAAAILRGSLVALFGMALLALGMNLATEAGAFGPAVPDPVLPAYAASTEPLFIVFMLIGVLFNYHLRGKIGTPALFASVAAMGALFVLCWRHSVLAYQLPGVAQNYGCALLLFGFLYAVRAHVPSSRLLAALAAISYPLYVVHSLVGYSVMKLAMLQWAMPYPLALGAAVVAVVVVATALHVTVERRTVAIGRRLSRPPPQALAPMLAAE